MKKLALVWDVERARPVSKPLMRRVANELADANEQAYHTPFIVVDAPNGNALHV